MDWLQGIQKAIDYIEENITEKIDYEEVAKRAYSSSFYFQRVFGIMCGFTLGEYIRMGHKYVHYNKVYRIFLHIF